MISDTGNEPGLTHLLLQNCQGDLELLQKWPNAWFSTSSRDAACFSITRDRRVLLQEEQSMGKTGREQM